MHTCIIRTTNFDGRTAIIVITIVHRLRNGRRVGLGRVHIGLSHYSIVCKLLSPFQG